MNKSHRVETSRVDPKTCLQHQATGRYCWLDEVPCANCEQILSNRAGDLADAIDARLLIAMLAGWSQMPAMSCRIKDA